MANNVTGKRIKACIQDVGCGGITLQPPLNVPLRTINDGALMRGCTTTVVITSMEEEKILEGRALSKCKTLAKASSLVLHKQEGTVRAVSSTEDETKRSPENFLLCLSCPVLE